MQNAYSPGIEIQDAPRGDFSDCGRPAAPARGPEVDCTLASGGPAITYFRRGGSICVESHALGDFISLGMPADAHRIDADDAEEIAQALILAAGVLRARSVRPESRSLDLAEDLVLVAPDASTLQGRLALIRADPSFQVAEYFAQRPDLSREFPFAVDNSLWLCRDRVYRGGAS